MRQGIERFQHANTNFTLCTDQPEIGASISSMKTSKKQIKRRVLTAKQWAKIQAKWECDSTLSLSQVARLFDVSLNSVKTRHKAEGWAKQGESRVIKIDGRPSLYRPEYCGMIVDFFKNHQPYREITDKSGRVSVIANGFPNMARFAAMIGVTRETLWRWATERDKDGDLIRPEFFNSYTQAKAFEEAILLECGAMGAFNPAITQLVLRNLHHYQPVVPVPPNTETDKASDEELDAMYEAALAEAERRQEALKGRFERITGETIDSYCVVENRN